MIYLEYMAVLWNRSELNPITEFDIKDNDFLFLFYILATPFVYNFVFAMSPFIAIFMPIFLVWYMIDPSYFEREVHIYTESSMNEKGHR